MRLIIQRVLQASVTVEQRVVSSIGRGFLVLCGVGHEDSSEDARWLARKTSLLRVFEDSDGKMNLPLEAVGGEVLVVSQFTLYGDCRKGNRPSFVDAAPPDKGDQLYQEYVDALRALKVPVKTGVFRAMMQVALINDGPVTLLLDSKDRANGGA
jgi:D-tyrosyl-tRNA(Tyr) deacylase